MSADYVCLSGACPPKDFFGDTAGGRINMALAGPGSFSTGFEWATSDGVLHVGVPQVTGPIVADISDGVLTVSSLPWGMVHSGSFVDNLVLPGQPDPGTLTVLNLIPTGNEGEWADRIQWRHYISSADDPSGAYVGFNNGWVIEGLMSTAPIPEPETYVLMLSGLGLLGVAARRRKAG